MVENQKKAFEAIQLLDNLLHIEVRIGWGLHLSHREVENIWISMATKTS